MSKERKTEPTYSQLKDKKGEFFYQKSWYENGKRIRKRITDNEYLEHLKSNPKTDEKQTQITPKEEPKKETPKKIKKTETEDEFLKNEVPAVSQDGDITEILGKIKKVKVVREVDEEDPEKFYHHLVIDVQDVDGGVHKGLIGNSKILCAMVTTLVSDESIEYNDKYKFIVTEPIEKVQKIVDESISQGKKTFLFRVETTGGKEEGDEDQQVIYAAVSPNWKKVKVKDLVPIVEKIFEDKKNPAKIKVINDPTGKHGGYIEVNQPGVSDVFDLTFRVDAGQLDGFHAMTIVAGCKILKCLNQLTFDYREIPGLTNNINLRSRQIHAGDMEGFKQNLVDLVDQARKDVINLVETSKKTKLTVQQQKDILTYFLACGKMSLKDFDDLVIKMADKDIAQVPNTMFGLAMVVSYRGSHTEKMSENKGLNISIIAGELIIVSPSFDVYYDQIVMPVVKRYEEAQKKKAAEEKK